MDGCQHETIAVVKSDGDTKIYPIECTEVNSTSARYLGTSAQQVVDDALDNAKTTGALGVSLRYLEASIEILVSDLQ